MSTNESAERERQARLATGPLGMGALGLVLGVMLGLLGQSDLSAGLTLSGVGLLLWGLHRLGRLGADPPSAEPTHR